MKKLNRMALKNADIVFGTLGEQEALRLDPGDYLSCGDDVPGVERCPLSDECTFAWKGREGLERVVDIDPATLKVLSKTDANGNSVAVVKEHAAGGPKNLAVYRKPWDSPGGKSRILVLPCYRFLANRKRWSRPNSEGQVDLIAILAREGDGKMVPMSETKETMEGTNRDGRPKFAVRRTKEYRAVPFHPRPVDLLPERGIELEVQDMLQRRAVEESAVVVAGLSPEDKPMDLSASAIPQMKIYAEGGVKEDVRQAARRAPRPA